MKMPFPDHGRLIPLLPQHFRDILSVGIQRVCQGVDLVNMAVLTGQNRSSAGRADGIGAEAVVKSHPARGYAVNIRGLIDSRTIATYRIRCVVVGHYEKNVWFLSIHEKFLSST
jgi:hypothetical protein